MGRVASIWLKELRSYFNSPIAYIFIVLVLALSMAQFFFWTTRGPHGEFRGNFFVQGEASLKGYFEVFPFVLSILIPALCMRLWPEETKSGTIEVLVTLPVRAWELVAGKYLAMLSVVAITLGCTLVVPWYVSRVSVEGLDLGPIIGGYVAAFLMGAGYCAVSLLASAFTREQIVAFLVSLFICVPLALVGTPDIDIFTPNVLSEPMKFIGFTVRFESIAKGVLDVRDIVYFLTFSLIFVFLNITVVQYRRLK